MSGPTPPTIGIDPGFGGAIAIYWPVSSLIEVVDMPIGEENGRPVLDMPKVLDELCLPGHEQATVWLERVAPRPGEGTVSSFRFGQGYGALAMAAIANGHKLRHVTPQTWKRHYELLGLDKPAAKVASRNRAKSLWPEQSDLFRRVKDHGRAEACLIAFYGWQMDQIAKVAAGEAA